MMKLISRSIWWCVDVAAWLRLETQRLGRETGEGAVPFGTRRAVEVAMCQPRDEITLPDGQMVLSGIVVPYELKRLPSRRR